MAVATLSKVENLDIQLIAKLQYYAVPEPPWVIADVR